MTNGAKTSGTKIIEPIPSTSPLYLHPSESLTLSLSQIKFDGENYDLWADVVRHGLDAKNKMAFVEGTIKQPKAESNGEESLESVAWRQCSAMVKSWLRNVIDVKLHPNIAFTGTVPEIWKELNDRFATGNAPRVHQLKSELSDCKQGKDQSVVEYYTQLKALWDELATYSRIPQCTCGAAAAILKEREDEKVHQFLMGLDSSLYGNVRSNLLMEDDITSLSRAYSLILREERHRAITKSKVMEISEAAMAARTPSNGNRVNGHVANRDKTEEEPTPPHCNYCNKDWHIEENCFEKHGYPTHGRGRGRRGGRGRGGRGRGSDYQVANSTSHAEQGESSKQTVQNLTSDELVALRSLLSTKGDNSKKLKGTINTHVVEWLLDSGASHHMTGKRELLKNIWDPSTRTQIGRGEHKDGVYVMKIGREEAASKVTPSRHPTTKWRVERKHRHILEKARTLLFHANLPKYFWGECVMTAAFLINRTPTKLLNNRTLYEVLYGEKPVLDNVRVFGCLAYAHNKDKPKDKFNERGKRCIFVGYPYSKKGWKLYDLKKRIVFESRDVSFYEHVFSFYDNSAVQDDHNVTQAPDSNDMGIIDTHLDDPSTIVNPTIIHVEDNNESETHGEYGG
ncbi:uncharacterized protein LOC141620152 [Silene latifolia]|uniref:uncharacterized protein LOC141620152 n=1 Tax=Silene latifolia TaxID=37657 RepID=UPI003D781351